MLTQGVSANTRIDLRLLNGFELRYNGASVPLPLSAQRLTAFLAVHGRPALRTYVAGNLWGELNDDRSHRSLRTALWRVRRSARSAIVSSDGHVALNDAVAVDLRESVTSAKRVLSGVAIGVEELDPLRLCADVLPDWYDDWVVMERERYRQLRLHALEALCVRLAAVGRFSDAVEAGLAAVGGEPLRESANLALVQAYVAEGNHSEALRAYRRYRKQLAVDLHLRPSRRLEDLIRSITGADVDRPPDERIDSLRSQAVRVVAAGQPTGNKPAS